MLPENRNHYKEVEHDPLVGKTLFKRNLYNSKTIRLYKEKQI